MGHTGAMGWGAPPAGAGMLGSSLDPQGPVARSAAGLWWFMLALGTAVFVLVLVVLVLGLWRRRPDAPAPGALIDPPSPPGRRWLVGGGTVLPSVVVSAVLVATIVAMRDVEVAAPPDALVIDVIGHQFWWEVRYPGTDAVTANELHLPVGRPVALRLRSADVIHSFWVPALAGKLDALPDGVNTLVLEADEPGRHVTRCAEFCGVQHANMTMLVVAEPAAEFAAWLDHQAAGAGPPTSPDAAVTRGATLFTSVGCAACHAVRPGPPPEGADHGPDLTHLASRPQLGGVLPNDAEHLRRWIADPHQSKTGVLMPATPLDDAELDAVVAYLGSLD
ncbi:MAG: cytochrome c oxidase subunit II [Acidimicrobiales bacterium]